MICKSIESAPGDDIVDSGASPTSFESILSLVVLRSTKKIKATTSRGEGRREEGNACGQTPLF